MFAFEDIWARALSYLRGQIDPVQFAMWMQPLKPLRLEEHVLSFGVPNNMWAVWLERNFKDIMEEALNIVTGEEYDLVFQVVEDKKKAIESGAPTVSVKRQVVARVEPAAAPVQESVRLDGDGSLVTLDRRFTFNEFVVGDCNRIAYAVSNAVAEKPGSQYNPYFIYSGTGMGKTHLLQAIAQEVLRRTPAAKVMYVTSEEMLNQYVDAMAHNQSMAFRKKYRSLDVLLIDDVQFIGTTQKFQEEFFHTFNALYNAHRQIVMTSDKPPQDINGLEKRLVSRFESGFTAEIQQPDLETRIAIIHKKQEHQEYKLDEDVVRFVAEHLRSSVRRLESGVFKLVSWASLSGVKIDVKAAEKILSNVISEEGETLITVESIQRAVAEHYDLRVSDITGPRRPANIAFPRQVAMYFSRKMTELSTAVVAEKFSRNHATVVHAVQAVEAKLEKSEDFRRELELLKRKLVNS